MVNNEQYQIVADLLPFPDFYDLKVGSLPTL